MAAKIKKGDTVIVRTGKDKGKSGEVLAVMPQEQRVLVQGINLVKRHQRQTQAEAGGIITKEAPLHISNVGLVDPEDSSKATRVGFKIEDGKKTRIAKRSGAAIA